MALVGAVVFDSESDFLIGHVLQSIVADGNLVTVSSQVKNDGVGVIDGGFGIYHPFLLHQLIQHEVDVVGINKAELLCFVQCS